MQEKKSVPGLETAEYHKEKIIDIVDKIEDAQFLKRVYIILRNHMEIESIGRKRYGM